MHDVFLSFTRTGDPALARSVRDVLTDARFDVFMDDQVPIGEDISATIVEALGASRLLVVIYGASYNTRWACQRELIHAYLVGAAEGDPGRRILVVNPELGSGHIVQVGVADSMHLRVADLHRLPEAVRRKLDGLPGPMTGVARSEPPRWLPPTVPGSHGFVGRFPDLWRLHNALTGVDRPLTAKAWTGPTAVVTGMPGIGKTSLVRAYAWLFGDAYPGGVFWTGVGGPGGIRAAEARFAFQVRDLASRLGIPTAGQPTERITVLLGEYLDARPGPALWVVDDVPAGLGLERLARFIVPAGRMRTVFTARRGGNAVSQVPLDGLGLLDGLAVLHAARPVGEADREAAVSIVERVGGHPLALGVIGGRLRDRQGLLSYRDYARGMAEDQSDSSVPDVIAESMGSLDEPARVVLTLAGLLAPVPVPVGLLAAVLDALGPAGSAGDTLDGLRLGGFASRDGEDWQIHPLVVEAAAESGQSAVPVEGIAATAAAALLGQPANATLIRHATALADCPDLTDEDLADALRRWIAGYHERAGDYARAAAVRARLAEDHPDSAADQVAAALARVDNGEYHEAVGLARRALDLGVDGDLDTRARWALAAALDGLGRFRESDELWVDLDGRPWHPQPAQRIAFDVSRARAMISRGRLRSAMAILEPLRTMPDDADDAYADRVNAARVETARLLLLTSDERAARGAAQEVSDHYRRRDAAAHPRCMEADLVLAEATVALALFELRPDTSRWAEAEKDLERLAHDYRTTAGPDSVFTLAAAVQWGLVLVRLGKQTECRTVLHPAVDTIGSVLGDRHPLHLRARYALALAHLQLNEHTEAAAQLDEVWRTQCDVLGPGHPHTLDSQLELGVAVKFTDSRRSRHLIDDVWHHLPGEIGRKNDLYGRTLVAKALLPIIPAPVIKGLQAFDRWRKR